jgi:hypothetical protein
MEGNLEKAFVMPGVPAQFYLLGKYYLGVKPTTPGFEQYTLQPNLGGLEWMQGKVPTPNGVIDLQISKKEIKVKSPTGTGTLLLKSKIKPAGAAVTDKGNGNFAITIEKDKAYSIQYEAY